MSDSFVHLHVHTEYSMLDGAARLKDLFAEEQRQGMEAYLTPKTHRTDRTRVKWAEGGEDDVSGGGAYTHMTLLAADNDGMHNLFRLSSLASLEGFFYKPRADRELLQTYGKGLIATTGCPSGEIQTLLRMGRYDEAKRSASEFQDLFGKENFYAELMDHG